MTSQLYTWVRFVRPDQAGLAWNYVGRHGAIEALMNTPGSCVTQNRHHAAIRIEAPSFAGRQDVVMGWSV